MLNDVTRDIWRWAIQCDAHHKFETLSEMYEAYWKEMLNTNANINPMWCDGDSSPLTTWDYDSPQPGTMTWDLNQQV